MTECEASRRDLALLQGVWEQVGFEDNGVVDPPDDYGGARTTFDGDHFAVRDAKGVLLLEGRFVLDATTMPKSVDWTDAMGPDAGKMLAAIYELEGDSFQFVAAEPGTPRPEKFRTLQGQTLRRFVRR